MTSRNDMLSSQFLYSDTLAPARGILTDLLVASILWLAVLLPIALFLWA
jgi:hypothetical protein